MIVAIKDWAGKIIAYTEFWNVGKSGLPKHKGEYVWIQDIWVHEEYQNQKLITQMVRKILGLLPDARFCYFTRGKYDGRISKLYKREEFQKLAAKMEKSNGRSRHSSTNTTSDST